MACPMCDAESDAKFRPFCSKRCAEIDLAKWLTGGYSTPSTDPDDLERLPEAFDEATKNSLDQLH